MQKIHEFVASRNAQWSRQKDRESTLLLARRSEEVDIGMMYARSVQRQDVFKFCISCKVHVNTFWSEMALMSYRIISLDLKKMYNRYLVQLNLVWVGLINKSFQNNKIPSSLVELSLSSNNLTSLSCGMFTEQMKVLKKLNLSHNRLTFLPEQLEE